MILQDNKRGFGMIEWILLIALLAIGATLAITFVGGPAKQKLSSIEEGLQPTEENATEPESKNLSLPENPESVMSSEKSSSVTENGATLPPVQTGLTKSPSFDTKYLKFVTDDVTQFSIVVTPLDLAGKTITGYEISLATRGYTLPAVTSSSVNLNEEGWYKSDWQCNTVGDVYRCLGKDMLREGKHSTVGLNFSATVDNPPPFLNVKLLDQNGTTVVGVGVGLKTSE